MAYVPVTKEAFAQRYWQKFTSYAFAAQINSVPLVAAEMARASIAMPVAFIQQQDRYLLVGIMSLSPKTNLFVGPKGHWLGRYVPADLRGYPFRLIRNQDDAAILCVKDDSGLIADTGEPIFEETGELTQPVQSMLQFLGKLEESRRVTQKAVAMLAEAGVIIPWNEKTHGISIQGLYGIDEQGLMKLADQTFLKLRKAGALHIAFAQLISTGNIPLLGTLQKRREQLATTQPPPVQPADEFSLINDDLIRFE